MTDYTYKDEYDKNLYQQEPNIDNVWCLELQ